MSISDAFSRGFETYRKNFWDLLILGLLKIALPVAFIAISLILVLPVLGFSSWFQIVAYGVFYGLFVMAAAFMALPFFIYPIVSGSVTALKKKPKIETAFKSIRDNYKKLLLDTVIYFSIIIFLLIESVALMFIHPVPGTIAIIATMYIAMRLYFWDILLFLGEKHPLRASWTLTGKQTFTVVGFLFISAAFAYFIGLLSIVPFFGPIIGLISMPFLVSSKAHFLIFLREGFKKSKA